MPTYQVTAPDGRKVRLTGDAPPSDADLDEIFASLPPPKAAAQVGPPGSAGHPLTTEDMNGLYMGSPSFPRGVEAGPSAAVGVGGLAALAPVAAPGALFAALRALANPYVAGGIAGTKRLIETGNPLDAATHGVKAGMETAVLGRLGGAAGKIGEGLLGRMRAASAATQASQAAAEAAPMVEANAARTITSSGLPSAPAIMPALARIASNVAPAAETAPVAAQVAAAAVPEAATAVEAGAEDADLLAKLSESVRRARAVQAGAPPGTPPSSIIKAASGGARMPTQASPAMAEQLQQKVLNLRKTAGLSRPQIAEAIRDLYGQSASDARRMVDMILDGYGVK